MKLCEERHSQSAQAEKKVREDYERGVKGREPLEVGCRGLDVLRLGEAKVSLDCFTTKLAKMMSSRRRLTFLLGATMFDEGKGRGREGEGEGMGWGDEDGTRAKSERMLPQRPQPAARAAPFINSLSKTVHSSWSPLPKPPEELPHPAARS